MADKVDPIYKSKEKYQELLTDHVSRLSSQQELLYASNRYAILLVFQAMDAAGKDGAIQHVMSGVNPQGCQVFSFKHPSAAELQHDFLWRTTRDLPERGRIGIFNRSYYEEVASSVMSRRSRYSAISFSVPAAPRTEHPDDRIRWKSEPTPAILLIIMAPCRIPSNSRRGRGNAGSARGDGLVEQPQEFTCRAEEQRFATRQLCSIWKLGLRRYENTKSGGESLPLRPSRWSRPTPSAGTPRNAQRVRVRTGFP